LYEAPAHKLTTCYHAVIKLSGTKLFVLVIGAVVIAAAVISPALGGPSLKQLVKKEVRKQLRNKQGPAGPPGPTGAAGPRGTSFNANATLPSGQTLSGVWFVQASGGGANTVISFVPHLPANLGGASVQRVVGSSTTTQCPGPSSATAGQLCVYERSSTVSGGTGFIGIFSPATGGPGADRRGAQISYSGTTGGAVGTWAVTAP
jgi:hypothetical protein